jgi:hypothetical protein
MPGTVRKASDFMYLGACLTMAQWVVLVVLNIGQTNLAGAAVSILIQNLIFAALWYLMAQMCRQGKGLGRILSSVLFALDSFLVALNLSAITHNPGRNTVALATDVAIWVVGLLAIRQLWNRESAEHFSRRA